MKLTPGSTKRGKAAKTAIHMYSQDKQTTPREKDLFKSLKVRRHKHTCLHGEFEGTLSLSIKEHSHISD